MKTEPVRAMILGPNRSSSQPWAGPSSAVSARFMATAPDSAVLLQPNSRCSSTR